MLLRLLIIYHFFLTWDFSWDAVAGKGFILRCRGSHVVFLNDEESLGGISGKALWSGPAWFRVESLLLFLLSLFSLPEMVGHDGWARGSWRMDMKDRTFIPDDYGAATSVLVCKPTYLLCMREEQTLRRLNYCSNHLLPFPTQRHISTPLTWRLL